MTADDGFGTRSWSAWPIWGLAAVALIEARGLVTTPEITETDLRTLPPTIVAQFTEHKTELIVGGGVSLLGALCLVIFVTHLARSLSAALPTGSALPWLVLVGGAVTGGAAVLGYAAFAMTAQAADAPVTAPTFAALQAATDGIAYIAYTPMVIVTGAVAAAGLRAKVLPWWLGAFSALVTVVMAAAAFLPFVNWFPALVWTLVSSLAMLATAPSGTFVGEPVRP